MAGSFPGIVIKAVLKRERRINVEIGVDLGSFATLNEIALFLLF
jgi:hypothetical protein